MITSDRMAAVDRNAAALGVPHRVLMESSGNAVARVVRSMVEPGARVGILCGHGNNGGDGFVAARFLREYDVSVSLIGRPETISTEIARANWHALDAVDCETIVVQDTATFELPDVDLFVDALVGTGVTGELREPIATVVERVNDAAPPVLAVDVPSGIDADTGRTAGPAITADGVITFHDEKPGLQSLDVPVTVADIGIPRAAERYVGPGDLVNRERDPESHKGDAGRILVIGGGPYTGAPALSGMAALRAGADLSFIACPDAIADRVAGYKPDLIVDPIPGDRLRPEHVPRLLETAAEVDVVIIGPGLGGADETQDAVGAFLSSHRGRCVVDADALSVIPSVDTDATLVLTPHAGEFVDLGGPSLEAGIENREPAVVDLAASIGHVIVLKGHIDVISDGETTRRNRTGNPGMTVGGTGDVLAGVIATFLVDTATTPLAAAAIGCYLTGAAGDMAAADRPTGLLASDLVELIPAAARVARDD